MNWSKVKTLTIIILLAVNLYFIWNLAVRYHTDDLISDDAIEDTVRLLGESGIRVTADLIPNKKPTAVIYESPFGDEYHKRVVELIAGTQSCTWHMINNGTKCILTESGDEFEFYDHSRFEVTYKKNTDLEYRPDDEYLSAFIASETALGTDGGDRGTERAIDRFMFSHGLSSKPLFGPREASYEIVIDSVRRDTANDWYVVTSHETIDGCEVHSRGLVFVVCDGEVIYMTGEFTLLDSPSKLTSQLIDQVNILFEEREYITAQRELSEDEDAKELQLISLTMDYCVSWNADRTDYYLIPAWKIVYSDGTVRLRNALNGSIYTI